MKQAIALTLFVVASQATASADDKKFTLADLKELVAQKSYAEAVQHLSDVPPSERKTDWQDLAATAAGGYIGGLSNDDLVKKVLSIEEIDEKYPQLLKNTKYTKPRAEIGLKAYTACFQLDYATEECFQHALKYVDNDPTNADLAFKMGKIVRHNAFHYVAMPYFKRAIAIGKGGAMCKDEDLKLAVVAGLGLPKDDDKAADARTVAFGACFDDLKKPILDAFKAEESGYLHDNACDPLKAKKALSADQAKGCK